MKIVAATGAASTYLGGKLAPNKAVWESQGRPLVELGTTLYTVSLRSINGNPIPESIALPTFRGLEYVHAYRRRADVDVLGFARAVRESVEDPSSAFTEAVKSMSPRLRQYVHALLDHDQELIESFCEDILKTMKQLSASSPALAEALNVIEEVIGEHAEEEEWLSWNPVRSLLELFRWK